ncbi:hypothetical protein LCGC14_0855630 [marine sediment metagenome]|uniref:Uncharacterized protein n=1 Tax=marine sediment metagenome TaxID=412755 RepID=A0A0F9PDW9_9ZZZZ
MAKLKVVRTWYVEAATFDEAMSKATPSAHDEVKISRLPNKVNTKPNILFVRDMLFVDDIPGGTKICCEKCKTEFNIEQSITEVECPLCGCYLQYPAGASW